MSNIKNLLSQVKNSSEYIMNRSEDKDIALHGKIIYNATSELFQMGEYKPMLKKEKKVEPTFKSGNSTNPIAKCRHNWFLSPSTYSKYCPNCHSLKGYNPPKL